MRICSQCGKELPDDCFNKGRPECRECSKKNWKERYEKQKNKVSDITSKYCPGCGKIIPISMFDRKPGAADGYREVCKVHANERRKVWRHKRGDNKTPTLYHARNVYLGVEIGEEVAARYFKDPVRAPYGTPGYDLICRNGFKINVKLSTANKDGRWVFALTNRSGAKCDFYLLIAMGSLDDLTPKHIWLIPPDVVIGKSKMCDKQSFSVAPSTVSKLAEFEKPIERLESCCNTMKSEA